MSTVMQAKSLPVSTAYSVQEMNPYWQENSCQQKLHLHGDERLPVELSQQSLRAQASLRCIHNSLV